MTYEELQNKIDEMDKRIKKLEEKKDENIINNLPIMKQIDSLQAMSDERYRINSKLMACKIITGTTNASAGTESAHAHYLNKTPNIVLVLPEANATIYRSKASDANNFYLKSSANSTPFTAFVLY